MESNIAAESILSDTPAAKGEVSNPAYFVSVTLHVAGANIRSGPSMDYEVLRAVAPGYPLLVLEQQDEWSQVEDFRKRQGWVANKLLAENNSLILKIGRGNLRSGPSLNDEIIAQLSYGTVLQIKDTQGDWLKVITGEGIVGWVHKWSVWP